MSTNLQDGNFHTRKQTNHHCHKQKKQKTEEEKKEIHKNYETKGMEFEALEDKYDSAKSENK